MKTLTVVPAAALAALLAIALPVPAQPGPGASGPGGPGGPGRMMMGRWGTDHTPGWALMTPEERQAHQAKMGQVKTREECQAEMERHRALMQERAKARGTALPTPRHDACAGWK